jgi:molybdate transport system ATP-binding protein
MRLTVDATITAGTFAVDARFRAAAGLTALFGPSGAGKSLTLAAIAGLLRPDTGTIVLDGEVLADAERGVHVPTQHRHVGMVFQHAALLPHRNPLDNVALAVHDASGRAERRDRAAGWLARVQADHLARASTTTLSGGEQQRVALARALAGRPRLLLLDEPFSALDQASRVKLRELLRSLVRDLAIPALLVTHDLGDVAELADEVVLYEPGRTIGQHRTEPGSVAALTDILGLAP